MAHAKDAKLQWSFMVRGYLFLGIGFICNFLRSIAIFKDWLEYIVIRRVPRGSTLYLR
jgi:hypothetical protein